MIQPIPRDADREGKLPRNQPAEREAAPSTLHAQLEASRAALAESEGRFCAMLEGATDAAVFTLGSQGQVTGWNTGAGRILGWAEADILGLDGVVLHTLAEREAGEPAAEMRDAVANGHAGDGR